MHNGGLVFKMFMWSPVGWMITPSSSIRSQIADVSSGAGSRVCAVADHFDAEVEPDAVHGADYRVLVLQRLQSRLQVCADARGVVLQPFVAQDVEHRHPDRARQRAAARR